MAVNGGSGRRAISVALNGTTMLSNFDIYAAAGGTFQAVVRNCTGVADSSGNLLISFVSVTGPTLVNGIEVIGSGTPAVQTSYLYDGNGSLVSAITPQGITTYAWDAANRLQSIQVPSGNIATQTYRYDDLRVNQASVAGRETWTWDGNDVLA